MFEVSVEETFAAGHALRNYKGKCENVHGHNYRVQVTVEGAELDSIGLLVDFGAIKKVIRNVVERVDHQFLAVWARPRPGYGKSESGKPIPPRPPTGPPPRPYSVQ